MLAIVICLIIILLFIILTLKANAEHFDTYYKHDEGAYDVYKTAYPNITQEESRVQAKYNWADKSHAGYTVYDDVYEKTLLERNLKSNDNEYNPGDYGDYDVRYDTKFTLPEANLPRNIMAHVDPKTIFQDNIITLSEKSEMG